MCTPKTLLSLNEDCLNEIFQYLEIGDRIALASTCQYLQSIVSNTSRKVELLGMSVWPFKDDLHTILKYMKAINYNVKELIIDHSGYFHALTKLKFPFATKVEIFYVYTKHKLNPLPKMFPRIETLIIHGPEADFQNLWKLRNLQHLDIKYSGTPTYCKKLFTKAQLKTLKIFRFSGNCCRQTEEDLEIIFKCKTVEEIETTAHQMEALIPGLGQLPRLRKLVWRDVYSNHDNVLYDIANQYPENLQGVYSTHWHGLTFFNLRNCKLSLKFITKGIGIQLKENRKFFWLESDFSGLLPTLTEANKAELIDLISQCRKLELLQIAGVKLESHFVESMLKAINLSHTKRERPLQLRFYNTNLTIDYLKKLVFGSMVNVSVETDEVKHFETNPLVYLDWKA